MGECELCGAPTARQFCSADCEAAAPGDGVPVYDPLIKAPPIDPTVCPF